MYFYYPCPNCGRAISVYDPPPSPDYDVVPPLFHAVKEHIVSMHGADKLLYTDDQLMENIRTGRQQSTARPM